MKTIRGVLLCCIALVASLSFIHAQTTTDTTFLPVITDPNEDVSSLSDFEVELKALEMATPLAASNEPSVGNFYSAQHAPGSAVEWPPLPGNIFNLPVWPLDTNIFVLDDLSFNYGGDSSKVSKASSGTSSEMLVRDNVDINPGDGGDDTNAYNPPAYPNVLPDYGTNLYISQWGMVSNILTGIATNTLANVEYEIQTNSTLTTTNWVGTGQFILGSDATNWTQFILPPPPSTNNLFFRLQSWASADDSGLPTWWELKYLGTTAGINPNAQDSAGDGYTIYQKFQMGLNPNTFYTPLAPQGVTVTYNSTTGTATITWLPSPGNVSGYTITNSNGNSYNVSSNSFTLTIPYSPDFDYGTEGNPAIQDSFQVQAHYSDGNSLASAEMPLQPATVFGNIIPGPSGGNLLAVANIPANAAKIRVFIFYSGTYATNNGFNNFTIETNVDIPVTEFTNGYTPAYSSWLKLAALPPNINALSKYSYLQSVDTNGNVSGGSHLTENWGPNSFYDGREQLKQNLVFQFRVADVANPFGFVGVTNDIDLGDNGNAVVTSPSSYVYTSFYDDNNFNILYGTPLDYPNLSPYRPFQDNELYRNFADYAPGDVDANGIITTGVNDSGLDSETYLDLQLPPTYQPTTNIVGAVPLLGTNAAEWLCTFPAGLSLDTLGYEGFYFNPGANTLSFSNNVVNYWGLPFVSAKVFYFDLNSDLHDTVFTPGDSVESYGVNAIYMNTAQPHFQTVTYDFWNDHMYGGSTNDANDLPDGAYSTNNVPGSSVFSPAMTNSPLLVGVGQSIGIAAFAKLEVTNSVYSGVYGYLQQYLTNAYLIGENGNVTTNTTGIVSPYGNYFATQAGAAAIVTMPDPDTGQQGTCTVYAVSLQLDANHDGNMDLSYNGPDTTSTNSPYVFWANNNYDRWEWDAADETNYMDDVQVANCPYTPGTATADCNYRDMYGNRVIPDTRDLEDYARLWVCGINSNLLANLPAGSTVTLNWGDVGDPNTNNPTIDLFQAVESDGGKGYLTNETLETEQINPAYSAYVGRVEPGQSVQLNSSFFSDWAGNYFIWCGVSNGMGGLNLTIMDAHSNVLAQATAYIQIKDIKQMYERWTLGDQLSAAPLTNAVLATDDGLPDGTPGFQYPTPQGTNTPYILFVHGWNMESWDKDRYAETAYKRLYWQGYQGRFGLFRWPTGNNFAGNFSQLLSDPTEKDNYDSSEYNASLSGIGLLNKLINLKNEYPGHVYVLAHSMGNVVTSEALRLAGTNQIVNTYVASQAAVSAHTYDTNVPEYSFYRSVPFLGTTINYSFGPITPDIYGNWFASNNGGGAGQVISLYNTNDYALNAVGWQFDQLLKPDSLVAESGSTWNYGYSGSASDPAPWNNFFKTNDLTAARVNFNIVSTVTNRYEVMAYAAQSYCTALGATPGVHVAANLNLPTIWPPDPTGKNYTEHFWHSAQFRGDSVGEWNYWNTLLFSETVGFNFDNP